MTGGDHNGEDGPEIELGDNATIAPKALAEVRWSVRPAAPPAAPSGVPHHSIIPDAQDVLLRWTEELDDERAVTLWAGLTAVDDPSNREAAVLRWIDWAGVTIPLGVKLRELVEAVGRLTQELENTGSNAERVLRLEPSDLLPVTRALLGWMRAREAHPGVVVGAARAIVLAREAMGLAPPPPPPKLPSDSTLGTSQRARRPSSSSMSGMYPAAADGTETLHAMLVSAVRRRMERAPDDECAELLGVYLRAQLPDELPSWALAALDFVLLKGDQTGHHHRAAATLAETVPRLWTGLLLQRTTPRDALRAVRLLKALADHDDVARELLPDAVQIATETLVSSLDHARLAVWSCGARAMGRLAGVLPGLADALLAVLSAENTSLRRRRAYTALGSLSVFAGEVLRDRRALYLGRDPRLDEDTPRGSTPSIEPGAAAMPESAVIAALAVSLPDLASDPSTDWVALVRGFVARGTPEAWVAVARSLHEIRQQEPEMQSWVDLIAQELRMRAEGWKGSASDTERAERAIALTSRLVAHDDSRTPSSLVRDLSRLVGRTPSGPGLRQHVESFGAEIDVLVSNSSRAVSQENSRIASRGAMVLEEIVDLLVDGELMVLANRIGDGGPRAAALDLIDATRMRLLKMVWTGLRRHTPTVFPWRRWLLRTVTELPLVPPTNRRVAAEVVRDQVFESIERLADDPVLGSPGLLRYVAGAVTSLAQPLRGTLGEAAPVTVLTWLIVRGALGASHHKLRRWLGDEVPAESVDRLFRLLELMARPGRDASQDILELAMLVGGDVCRLGAVLEALGNECTALSERRPETHWSGLPRFDLSDLATLADTLRRLREDVTYALTLDGERGGAAPGTPRESLTELAGRLNRMLTATSLKFVDATRRAEVVEHYVSEVSQLCEAIASACGPVLGQCVRTLLAKVMVTVRAQASASIGARDDARYIGRLKVLGPLSSAHEGGMATTYLAEGPAPGKRVVLKLLPWARFRGASADAARALFEGEMERMGQVVHPNIVSIVDAGFVDEGAFIALEYIPGASLETLLNKLGQIELPDLVPIVRDVAQALVYLHNRGILHRDVKPANVLAQMEPPPSAAVDTGVWRAAELIRGVLIDFGIATEVSRAGAHEGVTGTPGYIAPEVARGVEPFGPAVDVYALAVVVFEMLTGSNPFLEEQPDLNTVLVRHGSVALPWHRLPEMTVRVELQQLLADATRLDPRSRPTMAEFLVRWNRIAAQV